MLRSDYSFLRKLIGKLQSKMSLIQKYAFLRPLPPPPPSQKVSSPEGKLDTEK